MRGLARGRHRAESLRDGAETLRDSLPDAGAVLSDLREQAEPVLRAAREQAEKAPLPQRKRSRSKKPFIFAALAVLGGVIAYIVFAKRGQDPARLVDEPDAPDASPAAPPGPAASVNGSAPGGAAPAPAVAEGGDVPERASASVAAGLAQPTQTSSAAFAGLPRAAVDAPSFTPAYQPRSQVAAWDLPPSSVPPMREQMRGHAGL